MKGDAIKLCEAVDCTGCEACKSVCPTNSIRMQPRGSLLAEIPEINAESCIGCHACERVCPALNPLPLAKADTAYAAIAKDPQENSTSTSGGAAAAIAGWFINNGGTVYGAVSDGCDVFHKRCSTPEEINALKGSKYVKSQLRDSYREALADLKAGVKVAFFGTPCQIAGLKNFLKRDYDNLLTIDLVCHGTPSQQLLKDHISAVASDRNVSRIAFREEGFKMRFYDGEKIIYENNLWKQRFKDPYYTAFDIACSSFRDSCYNCRYASPTRVSDITIGDFWGLDKSVEFSRKPTGISLILPTSEKGKLFVKLLEKNMEMYSRPIEEAVNGNAQLRNHSTLTRSARLFRKLFNGGLSLRSALYIAYLPQLPIQMMKNLLARIR